jgi:amidase
MTMKHFFRFCLGLLISLLAGGVASAQTSSGPVELANANIADLQAAFHKGTLTAEKLLELYLARIDAYDKKGPKINSVIALNPKALEEARALDAERKAGKIRGPLEGIPFSLKDNINTVDVPTTGGSCLLAGSIPPADAVVVKKLRAAGAILISKDNLSEFAAGGGSVAGASDPAILKAGSVPQGLSSIGGQTLNPNDLEHGPAGSSSGTGAGVSAVFTQFGLGTDDRGSVRLPSSANGDVGLRPTLGLLSRRGLIPLSASFDTSGPIARNVHDIAVVLGVLAGVDPEDEATKRSAGRFQTDYTQFLKIGSLKGARIGVGRDFMGNDPETNRIMDEAIATMKQLGAIIVDPIRFPDYVQVIKEPLFNLIRTTEFKAEFNDYLKTLKPGYPKTLDEFSAKANDPNSCYMTTSPEKAFSFQYTVAHALDLNDPIYQAAVKDGLGVVKLGTQGVFSRNHLDAIIYPTSVREAGRIEPENIRAWQAIAPAGEAALRSALAQGSAQAQTGGRGGADSAELIATYSWSPELVVPAGMTKDGLPITVSFMGQPYSEPKILSYGYDFEQATRARVLPKNTPSLPGEKIMR